MSILRRVPYNSRAHIVSTVTQYSIEIVRSQVTLGTVISDSGNALEIHRRSVKANATRGSLRKENIVQFGPKPEENYIYNKKAQVKIPLQDLGRGTFVVKGKFDSGRDTQITVDSGAEENVCPKWWGKEFGFEPQFRPLNLRSAGGDRIRHYGEREVVVESPF